MTAPQGYTVGAWNRWHPPGTLVDYWHTSARTGQPIRGVTTSEAWLCAGTPVVTATFPDRRRPGCSLAHLDVVRVLSPGDDVSELSEDVRRALPAGHHRPRFDGLGEPNAWLCAVCWGDGWVSMWPCDVVVRGAGAVALAKSLGLDWSS